MASTIWRGYITFGLISIPVRLFRAARAERVSFRRLYRSASPPDSRNRDTIEDNEGQAEESAAPLPAQGDSSARQDAPSRPAENLRPVQQASVLKGTGEVLAPQKVVKGFEYEKDRFVAIEPEELKNIAPKTATQMEISEFVQLAEIDPVYFETSYYVVPEEAGEKAYALLYKALQTAGLVAVAQFAMHNREHIVIVRPSRKGLIAHTMFFSSEVRADDEYRADLQSVSSKELQLAETLIHSLSAPFEPEKYRDSYREKVEEIIARKVAGHPVEVAEKSIRSAAVVDITEALQRSLAALKKPAASERKLSSADQGAPVAAPAKRVSPRKTARA